MKLRVKTCVAQRVRNLNGEIVSQVCYYTIQIRRFFLFWRTVHFQLDHCTLVCELNMKYTNKILNATRVYCSFGDYDPSKFELKPHAERVMEDMMLNPDKYLEYTYIQK